MSISIQYNLKRGAGFYSELFFMINHYIYCKKENIPFILNTDEWLFSSWTNYFEPITNINTTENTQIFEFGHIIENYTIEEYRIAIQEFYRYNNKIQEKIANTLYKLNLRDEYSSIFIRRGDKLLYESKLYTTEKYIEKLLQINPDCKKLFIQTDDYQCILDCKEYINCNNLQIEIYTICKPELRGIFIDNNNNDIQSNIEKNKDYINSIKPYIANYKTVYQMNSSEIYDHTCDMLIGIEIILQSKYCILDYQSNVSRFIKLAHPTPENIYDIENYEFDFLQKICPAYPECIYKSTDSFTQG